MRRIARGEARDYLDVIAIRASGRFSTPRWSPPPPNATPALRSTCSPQQFAGAGRLQPAQVARYGVPPTSQRRPVTPLTVRAPDRLAGTTAMAIQTITELHERGVNIKSLTEPDIDTTTPMRPALFGIVAVFAQLRVDPIRASTRRGLEHARAQGRLGVRPTVTNAERVAAAVQLRDAGNNTTTAIAYGKHV